MREDSCEITVYQWLVVNKLQSKSYKLFTASACHQLYDCAKCRTLIKNAPKCQNAFF